MKKSDPLRKEDYIGHIIEAVERIFEYTSDVDENSFLTNKLIQDAVIRNFEVIGEASHNIQLYHSEFSQQNPQIPWRMVYAFRNRVAHGYFSINFEALWQTIEQELPPLHTDLLKLKMDS